MRGPDTPIRRGDVDEGGFCFTERSGPSHVVSLARSVQAWTKE